MFSSKNNMSTKKSKVIKKELLINGGDLDIYMDLFITDENGEKKKILTKKGDSLVANFLRILYVQMGRDSRDNVMGGTFYKRGQYATNEINITSITSGNEGKYRLTFATTFVNYNETGGKIALGGFQGIPLSGIFNYTKISDYILDVDDTTFETGWISGTGRAEIFVPITNFGSASYQSFYFDGISVGTGTTPTAIDDFSLEKPIPNLSTSGGLTYNNAIVSQDTNDSTSAQLTFTRTFTNNSSIAVTVNEIGLFMKAGTSGYTLLVMRDIIPGGAEVHAGKVLTINYRIVTNLGSGTDSGGFLVGFMRMLYRQASRTVRAIFDINNVSISAADNLVSFMAVKCGGHSIEYGDFALEKEMGWKTGIIIGTGEAAVSMGDYNLSTLIAHGNSAGQMLYYGGFAQNFIKGADFAQFDIMKAIENDSGDAILVKEYGLTVGACNNTSGGTDNSYFGSNLFLKNLFLIARNLLTVPVSVGNGEILKVVYTIKVLVGEEGS